MTDAQDDRQQDAFFAYQRLRHDDAAGSRLSSSPATVPQLGFSIGRLGGKEARIILRAIKARVAGNGATKTGGSTATTTGEAK
ncbi:MAG: hypothetical protein HZC24_10700 [Rhodocyclales bacterium]|nr:hypothetical protein [Rhodocyclales bacterium]